MSGARTRSRTQPVSPETTTTTMKIDAACSAGSKMVRASIREPTAAPAMMAIMTAGAMLSMAR